MTSTAKIAAVAQSVAEARPLGCAKYRATTAATAVVPTGAKSVGVGEARPLGFGKYSATSVSESELAEFSDEASSSCEKDLHWIAKCNLQDFVETMKIGGKWRHIPRKDCRQEWRPPLRWILF